MTPLVDSVLEVRGAASYFGSVWRVRGSTDAIKAHTTEPSTRVRPSRKKGSKKNEGNHHCLEETLILVGMNSTYCFGIRRCH